MRRLLFALLLCATPLAAQEFTGLARFDPARSVVVDEGPGARIELGLSLPVPWRVYTLDAPDRLVIDFREVDWQGARREVLLNADRVSDLRFGPVRAGWSRLVLDLARPMEVTEAGMRVSDRDGTALVTVRLRPVDARTFAAGAGAPDTPGWEMPPAGADAAPRPEPLGEGPLIVAIDPGHGGIDPGAEHGGVVESRLVLGLALELADAVARVEGMEPVLTRQDDSFVPLAERMTLARAAGADVFLSLHADALDADAARGASIYTLSAEAGDGATARMAERHDRGDLLAGLDLSDQDDTVARVLMDLARLETGPEAARLAEALVGSLGESGAVLNTRPRREAQLAVLSAADFPSVLVEVGFLSSEEDRRRLLSEEGRGALIEGLVLGLRRWAADAEVRGTLVRQ